MHGFVDATDDEKAQASRVILLVSRINLVLVVPMTCCMVAQQNGGLQETRTCSNETNRTPTRR